MGSDCYKNQLTEIVIFTNPWNMSELRAAAQTHKKAPACGASLQEAVSGALSAGLPRRPAGAPDAAGARGEKLRRGSAKAIVSVV